MSYHLGLDLALFPFVIQMDDASDPKVSEIIRLHMYCMEEQNVTEITSIGWVILSYAFSFYFY